MTGSLPGFGVIRNNGDSITDPNMLGHLVEYAAAMTIHGIDQDRWENENCDIVLTRQRCHAILGDIEGYVYTAYGWADWIAGNGDADFLFVISGQLVERRRHEPPRQPDFVMIELPDQSSTN